jgi:hypothetical protein
MGGKAGVLGLCGSLPTPHFLALPLARAAEESEAEESLATTNYLINGLGGSRLQPRNRDRDAILYVASRARLFDTRFSMNLLSEMSAHDHEQVIAFQNNATGLRGFLAIHDTTLGPALGGSANRSCNQGTIRLCVGRLARTFALRVSNGYTAGGTLQGGNIPLHGPLQIRGLRQLVFPGRWAGHSGPPVSSCSPKYGFPSPRPSPCNLSAAIWWRGGTACAKMEAALNGGER